MLICNFFQHKSVKNSAQNVWEECLRQEEEKKEESNEEDLIVMTDIKHTAAVVLNPETFEVHADDSFLSNDQEKRHILIDRITSKRDFILPRL